MASTSGWAEMSNGSAPKPETHVTPDLHESGAECLLRALKDQRPFVALRHGDQSVHVMLGE